MKVAGIFLDLQKAFDSAWHQGMIYRPHEMGIQGNILKLIHSFLRDRKISIMVNFYSSQERACNIGLPQGSVLSPLLFIVYIRDMLDKTTGLPLQFADDCTILSWAGSNTALYEIQQRNQQHICQAKKMANKGKLQQNGPNKLHIRHS